MEKPEHYHMVFFDAKEEVMLPDKRMERLVAIDKVKCTWCVRLTGAVEEDGQAGEEEVLPASQLQGALGTGVASLGGGG